jgi:methylphosphotriester-DNA--protein-cysteine methyltransferase
MKWLAVPVTWSQFEPCATEAARRLGEGEESVAAVAEQVGYANPAAFMKAFTRVHGVGAGNLSPRQPPETDVEGLLG